MAGELRGVLWHRCEASGGIDGEPFVEVRGQATRGCGFEIRQLPGAHMASAYCEADDAAAVRTYDAIDRWIHRHSLRLDGPKREIYCGKILEIQFPVRPF
jgi:effector-binding domain-containing protein